MGIFEILAIVVGAVAAIAGAVGTGVSVSQTNRAQRELSAQTNQWNLEQWNRQNEYNDPSKQIERLKKAGINPALANSQNIVSAGNSSGNLQGVMPELNSMDIQPSMNQLAGSLTQLPLQRSQIDMNASQSKVLDAEARKIISELPNAEKQRALISKQIDKLDSDIETSKEQINVLRSQKDLIDEQSFQTALSAADNHFLTIQSGLDSKSQRAVNNAQIQVYKKEAEKLVEETKKIVSDKRYINVLATKVYNEIKRGNTEFASEYGSTFEQIQNTIEKRFQANQAAVETMLKRSKWTSTSYYQILQRVTDHFKVVTAPMDAIMSLTPAGKGAGEAIKK